MQHKPVASARLPTVRQFTPPHIASIRTLRHEALAALRREHTELRPIEGREITAAGDIARYPSERFDQLLRVEHWEHAIDMGAHAARRLLARRGRHR